MAAADDAADAPSLIEFTVPNAAAIDKLNSLGFDLAEYKRPVDDGIVDQRRWSRPSRRSSCWRWATRRATSSRRRSTTPRCSAEADAGRGRGCRRLRQPEGRPRRQARRRPADTVLASRADYFENYAGRYISIEARPSDPSNVPANNPTMTAAWDCGAGTHDRRRRAAGPAAPFIDTEPPDGRLLPLPPQHLPGRRAQRRQGRSRRRCAWPAPTAASTRSRSSAGRPPTARASPRLPEGLHDRLRRPAGGLPEDPRPGGASSRTSRRSTTCRTRPTATSATRRRCSA